MTAMAGAGITSAPQEPLPSGRATRAAAARSEQLYAQHHRMVTGLCRALLRDRTEAEDAAQQVFLSAHRSLLNGAEPREAPAWLATIARNECWARIRGRMREPLPSDAAEDVPGDADPVAEALRRADLAALWRAIRALPKQQREALLLREFGGLRYDELAVALSVTEPAVESLLFRARTRLRAQLETALAALAPLARLLVSGGAPAVAAKAVAIGIGTAAVTGTAVVAPEMLEHSKHAAHSKRPAVRTVAPVRDLTPVALLQTSGIVRQDGGRAIQTSGGSHEGGGDENGATLERHDGGGETEQSHDGTEATTATSGDGGRDSGTGPGPSSGSSSSSGSEDGDRRGPSATTTTTTEPTTTTTTSSGDGDQLPLPTLTAPTVDLSGDGGTDGSGGSDGSSGGGSDGGSDGPGG
jgi:RNA polymerase sigma factor (sigma-70 family)